MLIHARLADRHNIHSILNAVLLRGIRSVQPCTVLPSCQGLNRKGFRSAESPVHPEGQVDGAPRPRRFYSHVSMKQQTALAESITTIVGFAHACFVHCSDSLLRDNIVVVVAATVFLSLGDLVLRTSGALEMFASGLPVQLLTSLMHCAS